MSAAVFVLAINLCVAGIFVTAFLLVAVYTRAVSARWLALAYGAGVVNVGLELILPFQAEPRLFGIGIFAAFLLAQAFAVVGLARNYRLEPPWRLLAGLVLVSMIAIVLIIDMDRRSLLRGLGYQGPYALMQLLGMLVVLRSGRRHVLDLVLLVIYALGALNFLGKPFLAVALGPGINAQAYIGTTYAAISQAVGAVLLIANGILMLVILLRDAMVTMTTQTETDPLSGLLNRRGFEDHAEKLLASARRTGVPVSIVVADLDHFKSINDQYGHPVGDVVISSFSKTLMAAADMGAMTVSGAILGRLGGEEFAALAPGSGLNTAQLFAERVRMQFAAEPVIAQAPDKRPTASYGVAQLRPDEGLFDLLRRADAALYEAKKTGRDRICVAEAEHPLPPPIPMGADRRQGSRRP